MERADPGRTEKEPTDLQCLNQAFFLFLVVALLLHFFISVPCNVEPSLGIELMTSSLPWKGSEFDASYTRLDIAEL